MHIQAVSAAPAPSASPSLPTRLYQLAARVKRSVVNFFRWILSFFLPVSPRAAVRKEELATRETRLTDSLFQHEVVLDGRATSNQVKFKKIGPNLHLEELSFPDPEIYAHAADILENLLTKEKAQGYTTHYLETARILYSCGFETKSTISFHPAGDGKTNQVIHQVIQDAKQRRDRLGEEYIQALSSVERQLLRGGRAVLDSLIGSFMDVGTRPVTIQLQDLLKLMDAVGFSATKGLSLGPDQDVTFAVAKE